MMPGQAMSFVAARGAGSCIAITLSTGESYAP
jgi:hypothetical protein